MFIDGDGRYWKCNLVKSTLLTFYVILVYNSSQPNLFLEDKYWVLKAVIYIGDFLPTGKEGETCNLACSDIVHLSQKASCSSQSAFPSASPIT